MLQLLQKEGLVRGHHCLELFVDAARVFRI